MSNTTKDTASSSYQSAFAKAVGIWTPIATKTKEIECELCERIFTQNSHFKRQLCNQKPRPVACEVYHKKFSSKSRLEQHWRVHSGERPFECHICEKRFSLKSYIPKHILIHSDDKPFKCDQCPRSFSRKDCLSVHIKYIHNKQPRVFQKCHVCGKQFMFKYLLKRHMKVHTKRVCLFCSLSTEECVCSKNQKGDDPMNSLKDPLTRDNFMFKCQACSTIVLRQSQLRNHLRIHRDYKCVVCDKDYKNCSCSDHNLEVSKTNIITSQKSGNINTSKTSTNVDDKQSATNSNVKKDFGEDPMKSVVARARDKFMFKCQTCSRIVLCQSQLSNHLRIHRDYKCVVCDKDYKNCSCSDHNLEVSKTNIITYQKSGNINTSKTSTNVDDKQSATNSSIEKDFGEDPMKSVVARARDKFMFKCQTCSRIVLCQSQLRNHLRIHRDYKCVVCDKDYKNCSCSDHNLEVSKTNIITYQKSGNINSSKTSTNVDDKQSITNSSIEKDFGEDPMKSVVARARDKFMFKCQTCSRIVLCQSQLRNHLRIHRDYKCVVCDKDYKNCSCSDHNLEVSKTNFITSQKSGNINSSKTSTNVDDKQSATNSSVKKDFGEDPMKSVVARARDKFMFKCQTCSRIVLCQSQLRNHLRIHRDYKCVICDKDYKNCSCSDHNFEVLKSNFITSQKSGNINSSKTSTNVDDKQSVTNSSVEENFGEDPMKSVVARARDKFMFKCQTCSRIVLCQSQLRNHLRIHRDYKCIVCDKDYKNCSCSDHNLEVSKTNIITYQKSGNINSSKTSTNVDDKQSVTNSSVEENFGEDPMKSVVARARDKFMFKCQTCSRIVLHQSQLRNHLRIHRDYKCVVCDKDYKNCSCSDHNFEVLKSNFITSQKSGNINSSKTSTNVDDKQSVTNSSVEENFGEDPMKSVVARARDKFMFKCQTCSRIVLCQSQLRNHLRIHRDYKCIVCDKDYKNCSCSDHNLEVSKTNIITYQKSGNINSSKTSTNVDDKQSVTNSSVEENFGEDPMKSVVARARDKFMFKCQTCSRIVLCQSQLRNHLRIHRDYKCIVCDKDYKNCSCSDHNLEVSKTNIITYQKSGNINSSKTSTNVDDKQSVTNSSVEENFGEDPMKSVVARATAKFMFKCQTCSRIVLHQSQLRNHLRIHRDYKCVVCDKDYKNCSCSDHNFEVLKSNFITSQKSGNINSSKTSTNVDDKQSATNSSVEENFGEDPMKSVVARARDKFIFKCQTCSTIVLQQCQLRNHLRIHRDFTCIVCNQDYRNCSCSDDYMKVSKSAITYSKKKTNNNTKSNAEKELELVVEPNVGIKKEIVSPSGVKDGKKSIDLMSEVIIPKEEVKEGIGEVDESTTININKKKTSGVNEDYRNCSCSDHNFEVFKSNFITSQKSGNINTSKTSTNVDDKHSATNSSVEENFGEDPMKSVVARARDKFMFKCQTCSTIVLQQCQLRNHLRIHRDFTCIVCNQDYRNCNCSDDYMDGSESAITYNKKKTNNNTKSNAEKELELVVEPNVGIKKEIVSPSGVKDEKKSMELMSEVIIPKKEIKEEIGEVDESTTINIYKNETSGVKEESIELL